MPKLRAGIGAKGSILTRFIKPVQIVANDDRAHRSNIVLEGWFANSRGSVYYEFRYDDVIPSMATAPTQKLHGAARFVKILKEGDADKVFIGQAPQQEDQKQEPRVSWAKSEARKLLYDDLKNGRVPLAKNDDGVTDMDVYASRPEFAAYDWEKFPGRLNALRKIVSFNNDRAEDDQDAFDDFVANNPVSHHSSKGYIQWQGSEAQLMAHRDIKGAKFEGSGKYRRLYNSRAIFYQEFPYEAFKDKIRQEIRTSKYKHTITVRGKTFGNPKQWPKQNQDKK
jgi:hypothetical protein